MRRPKCLRQMFSFTPLSHFQSSVRASGRARRSSIRLRRYRTRVDSHSGVDHAHPNSGFKFDVAASFLTPPRAAIPCGTAAAAVCSARWGGAEACYKKKRQSCAMSAHKSQNHTHLHFAPFQIDCGTCVELEVYLFGRQLMSRPCG